MLYIFVHSLHTGNEVSYLEHVHTILTKIIPTVKHFSCSFSVYVFVVFFSSKKRHQIEE